MWLRRSTLFVATFGIGVLLTGCGLTSPASSTEPTDAETTAHVLKSIDGFGELPVTAGQPAYRVVEFDLDAPVGANSNGVGVAVNPDLFVMTAWDDAAARRTSGDGNRRREREVRVRFHFTETTDPDACAAEDAVGPFDVQSGANEDSAYYLRNFPKPASWFNHARRVRVCVEVQSDFDGTVHVGVVSILATQSREDDDDDDGDDDDGDNNDESDQTGDGDDGRGDDDDDDGDDDDDDGDDDVDDDDRVGRFPTDGVVICHVSPRNPDRRRTIVVSPRAVRAHLEHGDTKGMCPDDNVEDDDTDNPVDPDPEPDPVVVTADAGPDVTVISGENVVRAGVGSVQSGPADPATLVYTWTQAGGPAVPFTAEGAMLSVDTMDAEGDLMFRLTVETQDAAAAASDDCMVKVKPVRIEQVTSGRWHSAVRRNDRSAAFWGWNRYGQMGDGSELAQMVSVDAAVTHTLYALSDGTVWTLGENKWADTSVPVQVTGVDNVAQVGALSAGGIMLRNDGSVWGFGDNRNAQCALAGQPYAGNGDVLGPILIPGVPANITSIATGNQHTVALDIDGNAWVWGSRFGCTPWIALDNVAAVAAGDTDLCLFARADGTAWAMGFNLHGQLGNGTMATSYTTPTQVVGLTDVVAVAAGDRHSMFLLADGSLWTAGWNNDCRLGLESETNPASPQYGTTVPSPAQVPLTDVVAMAGGYAHGVAVTADDTIWVWGLNNAGQLSDGTNESLPNRMCTPTAVSLPAP